MMKLVGSRQYFKATDAICITTSRFTRQAREIAAKEDIKLIDREKLVLLCRERHVTIPSLTVLLTSADTALFLGEMETSIGRDTSNEVVVRSPLVSRRHAVLKRTKLTLTLHDCGSTNGTFVNGKKIVCPVMVNYGDEIAIGGQTMTIALQTPDGNVVMGR